MSMSRIFGMMPTFEQINTPQLDGHLVWGWNNEGQLATPMYGSNGSTIDEPMPLRMRQFNTKEVSMGLSHTIYLTQNGKVYASGKGKYGRLGNGSELSTVYLAQIPIPNQVRVLRVAAGAFHSAFVTERFQLFTFGRNDNGQLGHGDLNDRFEPCPVTCKEVDSKVDMVACGADHTVLVLLNGTVFAMGSNSHHQVSGELPITEKLSTPTYVPVNPILDSLQARANNITSLSCGNGYTVVVKDGDLYSWGVNDLGQCGIKQELKEKDQVKEDIKIPLKIQVKCGQKSGAKVFIQVACGIAHTVALTTEGEVFGWGESKQGQLGQMFTSFVDIDTTTPIRIGESLMSETVTSIASGAYHSLALTSSNLIYGWGLNDYGQIGVSEKRSAQKFDIPTSLRIPPAKDGSPLRTVAAGGRSSMALRFYPTAIKVRDSTFKQDIFSIYQNNSCTDCEIVYRDKKDKNPDDLEKTVSILSHKIFLARSPKFVEHLDSATSLIDVSDSFEKAEYLQMILRELYMDSDGHTIANHLFLYVNNPMFSDVKICIQRPDSEESVTFYAHKCIIVNRSTKLKSQLDSFFQEGINNTIFLDNISPQAYATFLHYIYTDRLNVNEDNAIDLLFLAHSEANLRMLDIVQEYLVDGIDDDTVSTIYEICSRMDIKPLGDQCLYYIAKNIATVSKTESFNNLPDDLKKKLTQQSVAVPGTKKENGKSCIIN